MVIFKAIQTSTEDDRIQELTERPVQMITLNCNHDEIIVEHALDVSQIMLNIENRINLVIEHEA